MPSSPNETGSALPPTVVKLGLVSFFADVASEMLYPITPIFLTAVLGASVANVGLIEGVAEGTASLVKTYSGRWSDRLQKRKTFIWLGYLFAAVAKPLTGAASSWLEVLFARGLDRFGKGIRGAPRDALLAESVPESKRGEAYGWHRLMDTMGATVGPLLAILYLQFYSRPEQLRWIYFLALIPGLLSVFFVFSVRETKVKPRAAKGAPAFRLKSLSRDFKIYLAGWFVFSLVNSSDVFLLLRLQKAGFALTSTILVYVFYNLLYALASPVFGGLSDRLGRKIVLISGLGIFALVYFGFGFATSVWEFWALFGIYGLYMAATDGVGKAYAVDLVQPEWKATGLGVLGTVTGLATIAASSIAGLLWDHYGTEFAFLYGAAGAVLAILILLFVSPRRGSQVASHC